VVRRVAYYATEVFVEICACCQRNDCHS
jgi:hypothetical protein